MKPPLGALLPAWSALPFVGLLLSIALFPLAGPRFWHHHYSKVALFWGLLLVVPFVWAYGGAAWAELAHTAVQEYLPFIVLLVALFTIGGGIYLRGALAGTPWVNFAILAIGTLIASLVGTTGAAMLLIRPLLRANAHRKHCTHTVVFFIFLVANIGGTLTPLGDPPLFLGFLSGVPFFWTLSLGSELLVVSTFVLAVYLAIDLYCYHRHESPELRAKPRGPLHLQVLGAHNFVLLLLLLAAVILSGVWHPGEMTILGVHQGIENLLRDLILLVLTAVSWFTTPRRIRIDNGFSWSPIREVAILFAAIFATIVPALAILKVGERGALSGVLHAVRTPAHYFWATGLLSSLLDNAPTYLTFLSTALGRFYPGMAGRQVVLRLIAEHEIYLKAISTGAVFMGAATYLGNAPNFMVKAIAEEAGVKMPSFFGFLFRYALPVLLPIFLLVTWIFF